MSTIGINCGHTVSGYGTGAVGVINESEHTRIVGREVMRLVRGAGHQVVDCTVDHARNVTESLSKITDLANSVNLDWFVSIHFNAGGGRGTEVYTYKGRQFEDAMEVCSNIAKLGFTNRGVKAGTGLYVIRKTKAKSMLIEVCFVDSADANHYLEVGYQAVAKAIAEALIGYVNSAKPATSVSPKRSDWDVSVKDKVGVITASSLYVRYTPGGEIIGSLPKGSKVTLWRREGDWMHIYSPVKGYNQAYIHKGYVTIGNSVSNAPTAVKATANWYSRLQAECNKQGFSNQKVDGYPGANTLNGCPTLRRGARGNISKLLQEKLGLAVDGIFGQDTYDAVVRFQKAHGLTGDGIVGRATWKKLLGL